MAVRQDVVHFEVAGPEQPFLGAVLGSLAYDTTHYLVGLPPLLADGVLIGYGIERGGEATHGATMAASLAMRHHHRMPRAGREPHTFEEDLPFSSPLGRIVFGIAIVVVGLAWLMSASGRTPARPIVWAVLMTAFGVSVIAVGVRGLLRQLDHSREARRALGEHPDLAAELRRAKEGGKSPGRVLMAMGYENPKVRRVILKRLDLS